jgi:hypothetical protein
MKKYLFFIFSFLMITFCMADSFVKVNYYQSDNTSMKNFSYTNSIKLEDLEIDLFGNFKEVDNGESLYINANFDKDIDRKNDIFLFTNYENNTILNIINRAQIGVGTGHYFEKSKFISHKGSYALIFRDNCVAHSFRLKSSFQYKKTKLLSIINFIVPRTELRVNLNLINNISDKFFTNLGYEFIGYENNEHSYITFGLGFNL